MDASWNANAYVFYGAYVTYAIAKLDESNDARSKAKC